jgi:hypothetical protein
MNFARNICLQTDRREFLRDMIRYGALVTLAVISARIISRSKLTCINDGVCGGCTRFAACQLPAALSARSGGGTTK